MPRMAADSSSVKISRVAPAPISRPQPLMVLKPASARPVCRSGWK